MTERSVADAYDAAKLAFDLGCARELREQHGRSQPNSPKRPS
jgi:hypothetical protein